MNIDNPTLLFLLVPLLLLFAFLLEAIVLYFFRFKGFWAGFGISILVNLLSLALIYFIAAVFLSWLGYDVAQFNGLNLQPQVITFLLWFSAVTEAFLFRIFFRHVPQPKLFAASILMNAVSFFFLYLFIEVSH